MYYCFFCVNARAGNRKFDHIKAFEYIDSMQFLSGRHRKRIVDVEKKSVFLRLNLYRNRIQNSKNNIEHLREKILTWPSLETMNAVLLSMAEKISHVNNILKDLTTKLSKVRLACVVQVKFSSVAVPEQIRDLKRILNLENNSEQSKHSY